MMASWLKQEQDNVIDLKNVKQFPSFIEQVRDAEKIIFIYPLYVDSMPGIVKAFFEFLEKNLESIKGKDCLMIIHSGFSEAIHLRILERYHLVLKDILQLNAIDTIITPGSEGVRLMPEQMNKKRKTRLLELTNAFRHGEALSKKLLQETAGAERMTKKKRRIFKFFSFLGLTNIYWNRQLKQNKAFKKRFNKPYQD